MLFLWWFAFLEFKVPFSPLDLLHIPALLDPGEGHSIPDHPQAETVTNGIAQCLLKKKGDKTLGNRNKRHLSIRILN